MRNAVEFFRVASEAFGSQLALADATGLSQPTINGIVSERYGAGHKSLLAVSQVTGISVGDILSGAGAIKLRAGSKGTVQTKNDLNRLRACRALAELTEAPLDEIESIFQELGTVLPEEVPAEVWFDAARAALERKRRGLPLTRKL